MRVFLDHAGLEHPALTALGNDAAGIRVKPPARKPVDHLGEEHTKAFVLLQCLFDRFGSVFPQCGLMVFPGVVIVSR